MAEPTRCPDHAQPDADALNAWPCPDTCQHFVDELERRIHDVKVNGNFTRMWTDDDGQRWKQKFRNHTEVEEPQPW